MTLRWCVLGSLATLALAACSSHHAASRRVLVTATGRIGPLRVDESGRADVIAFAGRPESERRGRYDSAPPFDALGYGCRGRPATGRDGFPGCETVFYLDSRSRRLELFFTGDARYADGHGVHVGTPTATAERLLGRRVTVGCDALLFFRTGAGFLVMRFDGRIKPPSLHVVGGRVDFIVVHSRRRNPGVLDCIDS